MKSIISLLFLFFLSANLVVAQWVKQDSPTQESFHNLYFLDQNRGWICGYNGTILKTIDGGKKWISKNIGTLDHVHAIFFADSLSGWAVLYGYTPFRHSSIINTTDGGDSWNVQLSILDYTLHSIYFTDSNNGWAAGSNGIVYHTTNAGSQWSQQYPETEGGWLWPIFFIDNNVGWTVGDPLLGIFKTTDGGETWQSYSLPVVERVHSVVFLDSVTGWLCGAQGQIAKSNDGGLNWELIQSDTSEYFRDIFFYDLNIGWCVGANGTILYTKDGGLNWSPQYSGTSSELRAIQFINDQIGWAVGLNGTILKTDNAGLPVELISFYGKTNGMEVILNWKTATEINNYGFEVERKTKNSDFITIGFEPGFGTTTQPKNYTFNDKNIQTGLYIYRLRQVDYDGSYEYSNKISVEVLAQATKYSLYQNYPNPFNPLTIIKYSIEKSVFVSLRIYNNLGEEVLTLISSIQEAGNHKVVFNANDLSSGVYYYQLKAGEFSDIKKLVLIR